MYLPNKDEGVTINNIIKTGQGDYNIYISGDYRYVKDLIDLNLLVDLSDVYSSKAGSTEAKTIEEKMKNPPIGVGGFFISISKIRLLRPPCKRGCGEWCSFPLRDRSQEFQADPLPL